MTTTPPLTVKAKIEQALKSLLETISFHDITVSAIIQEAGISRMSFYRAYTDKFEMLEKICYENMIVFVRIYGKNAKWKDITLCILNIINSNPSYYYNILTCDEGLMSYMKALSSVSTTMTGSPASKSSYEIWMYTLKTWALNKFANPIDFVYKELVLNLPIREIFQDKDLDEIVEIYENHTMSYYRDLAMKKENPGE